MRHAFFTTGVGRNYGMPPAIILYSFRFVHVPKFGQYTHAARRCDSYAHVSEKLCFSSVLFGRKVTTGTTKIVIISKITFRNK